MSWRDGEQRKFNFRFLNLYFLPTGISFNSELHSPAEIVVKHGIKYQNTDGIPFLLNLFHKTVSFFSAFITKFMSSS